MEYPLALKVAWKQLPDEEKIRRLKAMDIDDETLEQWQNCCGLGDLTCTYAPKDIPIEELVEPEEVISIKVYRRAMYSWDGWRYFAKIKVFFGNELVAVREVRTQTRDELEKEIDITKANLEDEWHQIARQARKLHEDGFFVEVLGVDDC